MDITKALLAAGADPNLKDVVGETPLIKAVSGGRFKAMLGLTSSKRCDVNIEVRLMSN